MKVSPCFSLIELSIVIALFMIMATLVIVHGSFMSRATVLHEVEKLALVCRYLQQSSMMSNQNKILSFDRTHNSYRYDGTSEKLPSAISFGIMANVKGPPSSPTNPINTPITFEHEQIIFHPDGIIQPGTVYLISNDKQVMYALTSPVSQFSYIRIYRYDGIWHCLK